MRKSLLFFGVLSLLSPGSTPGLAGPPSELVRLSGQWRGPLKVPGGSLTLVVTIVPLSNGSYFAALDVPQQHISQMPVEVSLRGDALSLRVEQAGSRFTGQVRAGGRQLSGTWQQPGLTAPLTLVRAAPTPPVPASAARPAPDRLAAQATPPYHATEVVFQNPTARLRFSGTLTVPAGPGPWPALVLLPDAGPHNRDAALPGYRLFGILADYLSRRGVAVLRFDARGVGRSGGDYARATTLDLVSDAQAALTFLRGRPGIAAGQVGLLGHGEGANVALLAAAAPQDGPAFVASLAGYGQPGREVLRRQQGEILRLIGADKAQVKAAQALYDELVTAVRQTPNQVAARAKITALLRTNNSGLDEAMVRARAQQLVSPQGRFFIDFDPAERLPQVRCPVLLLNGTADLQVSAGRNLAALQKGLRRAQQRVEAHKLPGVNHYFQSDPTQWPVLDGERQATLSPLALRHLTQWLAQQRPPASAPGSTGPASAAALGPRPPDR